MLSQCDLHDLGYSGAKWTYDNKQKGANNVRIRLDRVVATPAWSHIFPDCSVQHLVSPRSYHSPLLIDLLANKPENRRPAAMRYEAYWEREEKLSEEVEVAWTKHRVAGDLGSVANTLDGVMLHLHKWSGVTIGSLGKSIKEKRKQMESLARRTDAAGQKTYRKVSAELDELLEKDDVKWHQRSRLEWIKSGDRNTSFFHKKSSWRAKKNHISCIRREDGTVSEDLDEIESSATNYFRSLFSEDNSVIPDELIELIDPKVD